MKQKYFLSISFAIAAVLLCSRSDAQYLYPQSSYTKPAQAAYRSNWMLNVGIGYGDYYGDMSNYHISSFNDIGKLRNFVNYNHNYISEPSFHLSVAKRLVGNTGLGFNFNRTLIQGSDRYVSSSGNLQTSSANFGRSLNFKTDILDAGLSLNLNGFTRGFFAPYLSLGAGVSFFTVKGDVFTGSNQNQVYDYVSARDVNDGIFETNLRDAQTETDAKYPNKALYLQGLLGFNFKITKAFSLALEADVKYSGSDYLDDLSGKYKTIYPSQRSAYIAHPGYNAINPTTNNRGDNDGTNDFYIQTRVVFRFQLPKYVKRSEAKKVQSKFNAPVIYPNNYGVNTLDSAAYMREMGMRGFRSSEQMRMDSMKQRRMQDSAMMTKMDAATRMRTDSLRSDSLAKARTVNVKMDSAYVNELKALRLEIAGLRQSITAATPKMKDSIAIQRATLKDSLSQNMQKLDQKKKKTATDSLQLQIYKLRLDSISIAEKYAAKADTMKLNTNTATTQVATPVTTTVAKPMAMSSEDSMRRVIDSLRTMNANFRNGTTANNTTLKTPKKNVKSIKDTLTPQATQQYQQQIAGLAYRNQQAGQTAQQKQSRLDSIQVVSASVRSSDSAKVVYYQNQLTRAQQQEAAEKAKAPKGLLVKKSDDLKTAETNRKNVEKSLKDAQTAQSKNVQNAGLASGDTSYIADLRTQLRARQVEIDSLKKTKKFSDVFSDKNYRIKQLEQQQKDQQKQVDDANKMLQNYRSTGPTSYAQPQYYPQPQYYSQPVSQPVYYPPTYSTTGQNGYSTYQNPPVNVVSPVVVSGNNDGDRIRMQREIDSLRSQVTQLRQGRMDTAIRRDTIAAMAPVPVDSTLQKSLAAANKNSVEMNALQAQLARLSRQLDSSRRANNIKPVTFVTDTVKPVLASTIYFNRGSAVLSTLQKAKLAALVKKAKKGNEYFLTGGSDNVTGNTKANALLARRRVTSVTAYLKLKGIATANISTGVNANNGEPGGDPNPLAKSVRVVVR